MRMRMTVKELAKAFGLKVNEFAFISGYSRQGLYDVVETNKPVNSVRFNAFIDHLQLYSNDIYERDIAQARIEKKVRDKLIEQLRKENENESF